MHLKGILNAFCIHFDAFKMVNLGADALHHRFSSVGCVGHREDLGKDRLEAYCLSCFYSNLVGPQDSL